MYNNIKYKIWELCDLPTDITNIENGIIMDTTINWTLSIDPQGQANKYIKKLYLQNVPYGNDGKLDILKPSNADLMKTVEKALQFGRWILLENVGETLDPCLDTILQFQTVKQRNGCNGIMIGEKMIDICDGFKLFMTSTLSNPHFSPELFVKLCILNFSCTIDGLKEQLMSMVVEKEAPELEEKKRSLVEMNSNMKKELKLMEDEILRLLSASEGSILDDESLIETLKKSKFTSDELSVKCIEATKAELEIDKTRSEYSPVAHIGSHLYFGIDTLHNIDFMYRFSLNWYKRLFISSIDDSPNSRTNRIDILSNTFILKLYKNISRSLFEKHKILLSFLITSIVLKDRINEEHLRFLITGPTSQDIVEKPQGVMWLTNKMWAEIVGLSQLNEFTDFTEYFKKNIKNFEEILYSKNPIENDILYIYNDISKLCILRCIRPDILSDMIGMYIIKNMGPEFMEFSNFNISSSYVDSSNITPLLFILSPGSDPVVEVTKLAKEQGVDNLKIVSLGQGQGAKAAKIIAESAPLGGWVLLQNCHLAVSWLPSLEKICDNLYNNSSDTYKSDTNFRIWLTSVPTKSFPISILQNSIKMTNEPPKGIKSNLLTLYYNYNNDILQNSSTKPTEYAKLIFSFCFFHAIVQDRRKFGAIGWNVNYDFTKEDLSVCEKQLETFMNEYDEAPYKVLNYLGSQINYGGRVTDAKDKILIKNILQQYINKDVIHDPDYKFSESGTYYCPDVPDCDGYVSYIKTLPNWPSPEVFGLHENAQICFLQNETVALLDGMLSLRSKSAVSTVGAKSRDEILDAAAAQLIQKTPKLFDIEHVREKFPVCYSESMNTVIVEEIAGDCIYVNETPPQWTSKGCGYLSLKPLSLWMKDLNERVNFIHRWIVNGTPACIWISGLFFPQALLTGNLQNFARKNKVEIDRLSLDFEVLHETDPKKVIKRDDGSFNIFGIFIEGCRWDPIEKSLNTSYSRVLNQELPIIKITPRASASPSEAPPEASASHEDSASPEASGPLSEVCPEASDTSTSTSLPGVSAPPGASQQVEKKMYSCPVYKIETRAGTLTTTGHSTNFVFDLKLPTNDEPEKWVRAGVACFLSVKN
eukprot:GHVL01019735.1.p1 GENE.GHVL01019735.1~~GHVL01019735.1.p1  ORF type:complete len:1123 (+),score=306.62 GHVL01019735.1:74-3370(+)